MEIVPPSRIRCAAVMIMARVWCCDDGQCGCKRLRGFMLVIRLPRTASAAQYKLMLEMFLNCCVQLISSVKSKHYCTAVTRVSMCFAFFDADQHAMGATVAVRSPGVSRVDTRLSRGPAYRWIMVYNGRAKMATEVRGALRHSRMFCGPCRGYFNDIASPSRRQSTMRWSTGRNGSWNNSHPRALKNRTSDEACRVGAKAAKHRSSTRHVVRCTMASSVTRRTF